MRSPKSGGDCADRFTCDRGPRDRPDAAARHVPLKLKVPAGLPPVRGDEVFRSERSTDRELTAPKQLLEVAVETDKVFAALSDSRGQPSVRNFVAAELLVAAERAKPLPLRPELGQLDTGKHQQRVEEPHRLFDRVGRLKIFGLVTRRRKLASTIGISVKTVLDSDPTNVSSTQARASA
jgi:hypothetical protein